MYFNGMYSGYTKIETLFHNIMQNMLKKKGKAIPGTGRGGLDFEVPTFSGQSAHRWR
jgi:hypothetical protein